MKVVIQRVKNANVEISKKIVGSIDKGLVIFLGIKKGDTESDVDFLVKKVCNLRIFEDENLKMNLSIQDVNGEILLISQFTLYADCRKGNRPSFIEAEESNMAEQLYEYFKKKINVEMKNRVKFGEFGADMKVSLVNDGPVTIVMESN
ncbi:MAG: D-tyrosyl-tRNA(Tyr) deacylase [Clostridiales bacterium]|nr:D-tyrosyl-tRNA(Tyr) deacylase [Clostridiales bacterium]